MRTYVNVQMDSEGASFSEVAEVLEALGFRPQTGRNDFVYEWDRHATVKDSLWFADRIHAALRGKRVWFRVETVED